MLGSGGMGVVYLAHDTELDRPFALKVPHVGLDDDPSFHKRFLREARAAARFRHPNFCPIYDVGEADGRRYLAMAYIAGTTLSDLIRREAPLAPGRAAEIARTLARSMAEAHRQGIIHRDLKPANVLVEPGGTLVITDFGVARLTTPDASVLTQTGAVVGTPAYMAPEQVDGDPRDATPAIDIYALGVILYELLTGSRPFEGTPARVLAMIVHDTPAAPSSRRPGLDPTLDAICLRALARDPVDRYPSMDAFADALSGPFSDPAESRADQVQVGTEQAQPSRAVAGPVPARKIIRDRRRGWVYGLACVMIVLAIVAWAAHDFRRLRLTRDERSTTESGPITNSIGMKLVLIPAGEFLMGSADGDKKASSKNASYDEYPQHRVRITKPFYLGATEVTRGQFRRFVDDAGYRTEAERDGKGGHGLNEAGEWAQGPKYTWQNLGFEQTDEHPVVNVSWNDAVAFCKWLSREEGVTYRLPTEAEWEYACRAGTTTKYSSGDDPEGLAAVGNIADGTAKAKYPDWTRAIAAQDGFIYTAPVGRYNPNAWGLFDMHGNVREWCSDGYAPDYYKRSPLDDPQGAERAPDRVIRGGGWDNGPPAPRSASRGGSAPGFRHDGLGFRLARVQSVR
jgi:formylglycine-generating enzyme required for sulfatase activity